MIEGSIFSFFEKGIVRKKHENEEKFVKNQKTRLDSDNEKLILGKNLKEDNPNKLNVLVLLFS